MNSTARAARREREERHKRELRKRNIAWGVTTVAAAIMWFAVGYTWPRETPAEFWHPAFMAPNRTPLEVTIEAYRDSSGDWRSMDNGRTIPTPKQFRLP